LVVELGRSAESWRITWSIAYEFLRVVTHRSALLHPLSFTVAWGFIERLRLSPSFGFLVETDRHAEVVRDLALEYPRTSGNRMHDLHITALMRENGVVELRTADVGFHEFKFLRVVNPL
jgi:predicted nucleic acid-binding protein